MQHRIQLEAHARDSFGTRRQQRLGGYRARLHQLREDIARLERGNQRAGALSDLDARILTHWRQTLDYLDAAA